MQETLTCAGAELSIRAKEATLSVIEAHNINQCESFFCSLRVSLQVSS